MEQVLDYLRAGYPLRKACRLAGAPVRRFLRWIEHLQRLAETEDAALESLDIALRAVARALQEGDLLVSLWLLEWKLPEVWGSPEKRAKNHAESRQKSHHLRRKCA